MQLYVSHWRNQDLADDGLVKVGISRGVPRWRVPYEYENLRMLAPTREEFKIDDRTEFTDMYCSRLAAIGVEKIVEALVRIAARHPDKSVVLLCWEWPGDVFCHRHVLADWLCREAEMEVPELPSRRRESPKAEPQLELF